MKKCFSCKKELNIEGTPARADTCPACTADIKVCLNCGFYDANAYNECHEPQAERVTIKDRSNFCDYFKFSDGGGGDEKTGSKDTDALAGLKGLFS
ncbi:MAG: hypothetical protein V3T30_04995 [Thermodesulfobacteriota bacterium]